MSYAKNNRNKKRRRDRKRNGQIKEDAAKFKKMRIDSFKKEQLIKEVLSREPKKKKDNKGLVDKFKRLLKLKI